MSATGGQVGMSSESKSWFGHPRQLARLFTTEMWERFGYYGMRAILTLYLVNHFVFRDKVAYGLYGAFTSLVYLTPLFGGLIADRYLGSKRSVKLGAILMSIGYFGLCFGGSQARPYVEFQNQRHYVTMVPNSEHNGGKRNEITIEQVTYVITPREDGGVQLKPKDESQPAIELAKGSFRFDGERDLFWVQMMLLSLSCVIVGNGFFKPNISTMVGSLYAVGDARRDGGFTIFYMGINLGSMISQALCPWAAAQFGWWAGFLLAAIGMAVAWALFQFDGNRLAGYGEPPAGASRSTGWIIVIGALAAIPLMWFLLNNSMNTAEAAAAAAENSKGVVEYLMNQPILGKVLFVVFFLAVFGIPAWAFFTGSRQEFQMMVVAIVLVVFSVVFWTLFEQAGSSLTVYAERNTNLEIKTFAGSYNMPAGQTQIFNPLFIVLLAPVFSLMWAALARRNLEPSTPVKFAIGIILVGVGFLVLVYGARFANDQFRTGLIWLVLAYLIHSIGELCLSPVGLSMITKLSMARVVGLMMGVWFLSSSMAQYAAGVIAQLAASESVAGEAANPQEALRTSCDVFTSIGWVSVAIGVGLLLVSPILKRMMHGVR